MHMKKQISETTITQIYEALLERFGEKVQMDAPHVGIADERCDEAEGHKFEHTYCSQCGGDFGPGNAGYSHCDQHRGKRNLDD